MKLKNIGDGIDNRICCWLKKAVYVLGIRKDNVFKLKKMKLPKVYGYEKGISKSINI